MRTPSKVNVDSPQVSGSEPHIVSNLLTNFNESVYVPSIIENCFKGDLLLMETHTGTHVYKNIRLLLIQWSIILKVQNNVFYGALFYLDKYVSKRPIPEDSRPMVLSCLALSRKYQKGHGVCLEKWEERLLFKIGR